MSQTHRRSILKALTATLMAPLAFLRKPRAEAYETLDGIVPTNHGTAEIVRFRYANLEFGDVRMNARKVRAHWCPIGDRMVYAGNSETLDVSGLIDQRALPYENARTEKPHFAASMIHALLDRYAEFAFETRTIRASGTHSKTLDASVVHERGTFYRVRLVLECWPKYERLS